MVPREAAATPARSNGSAGRTTPSDFEILDTLPEQLYHDLTALAAGICQTPMALIALVGAGRHSFKAKLGLDGIDGAPQAQAFAAHAAAASGPLIVKDASLDHRFDHDPLVNSDPHIRFYAGVPLMAPTGEALGTLCVIDRQSRELTAAQVEALQALSRQATAQLELRHAIYALERRVVEQDAHARRLETRHIEREPAPALAAPVELSLTDRLTSIGNRRAFDRRLLDDVSHTERYATPMSLLMIDIDRSEDNDRAGDNTADQTLVSVARLLQQSARVTDFVARYSGREFAVLLPHTSRDGVVVLAERFRRAVERATWREAPVTVSIGAATYTPGSSRPEDLVAGAGRALHSAKERGRNRVLHVGDLSAA